MEAVQSDGADEDANSALSRAIQLLKEALVLVDKWGAAPEIGARLEALIDTAEDHQDRR